MLKSFVMLCDHYPLFKLFTSTILSKGNFPVCLAQSIIVSSSQTLVLPELITQSASGIVFLCTIIETCVVGTFKILAISPTPTIRGFPSLERGIVLTQIFLRTCYWFCCSWSWSSFCYLYIICTDSFIDTSDVIDYCEFS